MADHRLIMISRISNTPLLFLHSIFLRRFTNDRLHRSYGLESKVFQELGSHLQGESLNQKDRFVWNRQETKLHEKEALGSAATQVDQSLTKHLATTCNNGPHLFLARSTQIPFDRHHPPENHEKHADSTEQRPSRRCRTTAVRLLSDSVSNGSKGHRQRDLCVGIERPERERPFQQWNRTPMTE